MSDIKKNWRSIKTFLDNTGLYLNLNYVEDESSYHIWVNYEDTVMWTELDKSDIQVEDFLQNYATKTVLKRTVLENGRKQIGTQETLDKKYSRKICYQGKLSTLNDPEYHYTSILYDEEGNVITDPELTGNTVATCVRFEPNYDYDIINGIMEFWGIHSDTDEIFVDVIGNPDIPKLMGGSIGVLLNEMFIGNNISVDNRASMQLKYIEGAHTNVVVVNIRHHKGCDRNFQIKINFFSSSFVEQ